MEWDEISESGIEQKLFEHESDQHAAVELARYIVWLGKSYGQMVSSEALGKLALECVGRGRWWGEVADDLGLPYPPDWE